MSLPVFAHILAGRDWNGAHWGGGWFQPTVLLLIVLTILVAVAVWLLARRLS